MSHTPEPWNIITLNEHTDGIVGNYCREDIGQIQVPPDNAARIVSCVNDCSGLNPAAYRESVEALQYALSLYEQGYFENAMAMRTGRRIVLDIKTHIEQALAHAEQTP